MLSGEARKPTYPHLFSKPAIQMLTGIILVLTAPVCLAQSKAEIERTEIGNLQNYYSTLDPHYQKVVAQLPGLKDSLIQLRGIITTTQEAQATD
jgi:hypothetical protein